MNGINKSEVYVEGKGIINTALTFDNGIFTDIGSGEGYVVPDNCIVLPGFIDEHIHGSAGADAMDGSVDAITKIAESVACEGTTAFLATTMTQSTENIIGAMNAVKTYRQSNCQSGADVLGVHLEGPFINKAKAGAQPSEYIIAPNAEVFDDFYHACGNAIKIVTFAPEIEGSESFIRHLCSLGVNAQVGHTSANFVCAKKALEVGATGITHTFNAQSAFTHREVGVVGAALLLDGYACEIICDTIHVSVPAIQTLIKNKPHDKVILITDAMRAKNLGDVVSELGGQTVYVKNGEARLADGTLAGSVLKMNVAIKNLVEKCGISLTDAVDFASANPAKNLGVFDKMGGIAVGKEANFTVISKNDFSVITTVRRGKVIYSK